MLKKKGQFRFKQDLYGHYYKRILVTLNTYMYLKFKGMDLWTKII